METTASNPLASLAWGIPLQTLRAASIAGRLFGAGFAIAVAFDQSYNPTQVFTVVLAGLVLATLAPLSGSRGDVVAALGAGMVFFAGTVLTHLPPGLAMLAMGAFAGLAAFALAQRNGRNVTLPAVAFLSAAALTGAIQIAIVFGFE